MNEASHPRNADAALNADGEIPGRRRIRCYRITTEEGEAIQRQIRHGGAGIEFPLIAEAAGGPFLTVEYPPPPGPEESVDITPRQRDSTEANQLLVAIEFDGQHYVYQLGPNQAGNFAHDLVAPGIYQDLAGIDITIVVAMKLPSRNILPPASTSMPRIAKILEPGKPEIAVDEYGTSIFPTGPGHALPDWVAPILRYAGFAAAGVTKSGRSDAAPGSDTPGQDAVVQLLQEHFGSQGRLVVIFTQ